MLRGWCVLKTGETAIVAHGTPRTSPPCQHTCIPDRKSGAAARQGHSGIGASWFSAPLPPPHPVTPSTDPGDPQRDETCSGGQQIHSTGRRRPHTQTRKAQTHYTENNRRLSTCVAAWDGMEWRAGTPSSRVTQSAAHRRRDLPPSPRPCHLPWSGGPCDDHGGGRPPPMSPPLPSCPASRWTARDARMEAAPPPLSMG